MTSEFLSPLPASGLPLSRHELDRDYLSRGREGLIDELWADAATRVLPLWHGSAPLAPGSDSSLALVPPQRVPQAGLRLYLGRALSAAGQGAAVVAVVIDEDAALRLEPDRDRWVSLRTVGSRLSDADAGYFTTALALANWHASHGFSPRTGEPTVSALGGWVRTGPDGREVFPRTDPAIIVGIVDEQDRILLGSNAAWEANRFSLLAGFVEPGESLESAVVREVFEESGIRVTDPVYVGSQPWPFPASLMLGFIARVDPSAESTLVPDGEEILSLRWFSRQELAASIDEIVLPGHASIARAIIEHWYGGPIEDRVDW